jgi:hypothetical protein
VNILLESELHSSTSLVIKSRLSSPSVLYLVQAVVNSLLDLSLFCLIPNHLHILQDPKFGWKMTGVQWGEEKACPGLNNLLSHVSNKLDTL